jgi:hypothetical protein
MGLYLGSQHESGGGPNTLTKLQSPKKKEVQISTTTSTTGDNSYTPTQNKTHKTDIH